MTMVKRKEMTVTLMVGKAIVLAVEVTEVVVVVLEVAKVVVEEAVGGRGAWGTNGPGGFSSGGGRSG